jgi:hypothetical protein
MPIPPKGGRTEGALTVKKRDVAIRLRDDGDVQPLEVLYQTMRHLWLRSKRVSSEEMRDDLMSRAATFADKAAPYVTAKLATTTVKGDADNPLVVQQETTIVDERKPLDAFIAEWVRPAIESSASEH